jgi:hypothetical protein
MTNRAAVHPPPAAAIRAAASGLRPMVDCRRPVDPCRRGSWNLAAAELCGWYVAAPFDRMSDDVRHLIRRAPRAYVADLRRKGSLRAAVATPAPPAEVPPPPADGSPPSRRPPGRPGGWRPRRWRGGGGWDGEGPARPRVRKLRLFLILTGLLVLAVISTVFGMMMAVASDVPLIENQYEYQ